MLESSSLSRSHTSPQQRRFKIVFQVLNALMVLFFLYAVSVQFNDPDPLTWITLYLSAAVFSVAAAFDKLPSIWAATFSVVALAWALTLVPTFWGRVSLSDVFAYVGMKTEEIEVAREFGGLMIVSVWVAILGLRGRG